MRSVMNHSFSQVPKAEIPRSSFDRSHGHKTTFNANQLVPFFVDEGLPGDTFNLKTSGFARLATPIFPIMDNLFMDTFYFSVPIRLIWENFQKFMGEQDNPGDSTDYLVPIVESEDGFSEGGLHDHLGMATGIPNSEASALYHRAYHFIFNEWFRDQNLLQSTPVNKGDGPDTDAGTNGFMATRSKRHDYFTSCLPWPQKGPDVQLPLGQSAQVVTNNMEILLAPAGDIGAGETRIELGPDTGAGDNLKHEDNFGPGTPWAQFGSESGLEADLSNATSATINQLREAFQVQKMYERDARGGTRYIELVHSHFGVSSPDLRATRPEYLGGGSTPINITPIESNAETDPQGTPAGRHLGELAAIGTAAFAGHGFTKSFTEHVIVIGLVNVRADLTYQQGMNRMFNRRDRLDFYWPALSHIGEQEVLNKEIFYQDGVVEAEANEAVFGYQERFAEYRYKPSQITGKFRSNATGTLDAWHLSQDFANLPTLNALFIAEQTPIARVIAVEDEPHFIADFHHKLICARPMPLYGVPGNMDRF